MKKFFLHDGQEQVGPFEIEELKQKNITKDTNVWADGMDAWDKAGNIEELKSLFASTPPPFIKTPPPIDKKKEETKVSSTPPVNNEAKKKSPIMYIIGGVVLLVIAFLYFTNQNSNSGGNNNGSSLFSSPQPPREKTPEELRQELIVKEQTSPSDYLVHKGTWRENLLGTTVLEGSISNTATLANFKDVVLAVTWLTKTNTELKTSRYSVFEIVSAGKTITYKLKVDAPSATAGVRIGVESAVPVN